MVPTKRLYSHWVYGKLDEYLMNEAAQHLIGEHDFASFSSVGSQVCSEREEHYRGYNAR